MSASSSISMSTSWMLSYMDGADTIAPAAAPAFCRAALAVAVLGRAVVVEEEAVLSSPAGCCAGAGGGGWGWAAVMGKLSVTSPDFCVG